MAAAAAPQSEDRVTDWLYELQRLTTSAASLPPAARAAVVAMVDTFEAEDGFLPEAAARARTVLTTTAFAPEAPTTHPPEVNPDACGAALRVLKHAFG